jgi:hypothetical protein
VDQKKKIKRGKLGNSNAGNLYISRFGPQGQMFFSHGYSELIDVLLSTRDQAAECLAENDSCRAVPNY